MNAEIKSGENFLDETTKWVYADEKGIQVFALYGIGDGTDATPLYAVGGKQAVKEAKNINVYMEGSNNDGSTVDFERWLEVPQHSRMGQGGSVLQSGRGGRNGDENGRIHSGQHERNSGRSFERGTENQRGVKDQFSLRDPVGSYQGAETRSEGKAQRDQLEIRESFADEIEQWDKDGKPEGVRFTLGSTGPVLQGLGAIESDIYMEGDKISTILQDHPEMTLAEIKKIPQILEDPALVLKSKTRGGTSNTRLVLLNTAKAKNRRNIVVVLDLRPVEKGFAIDDIQKVSSAYTKTATENRTAKENSRGFLKTSDVLFLDKKRATSLLKTMGFSMPIELHRNGYVGSISYFKQNVNIKGLPFSSVVQEGDVQFAIREIGGKVMPVLDTQKDTRDYSAAEAYLKTLVDTEHPFSTILMDAQPVYIGRDLPGEYKGSDYTYGLNRAMRQVKMQAATNLDEMLLLAENGEWRENIKEKHKVDAKNGWYRYSTQFAVPVLDIKKSVDHYTVYSGTLLIRNDADGKSYLYDLLDIKKEKVISSPSFSARGRSEVFEPKPSQTQYTQDQKESQAQIRSSTLSDRDVLRIAAQMAKNSESMLDIKKNHPASSLFRAYNSVPAASAE